MEVRRIVVVGMGSIGRRHARLLAERNNLRVELCEPDPERLQAAAEELGNPPTHADFEVVLASQPELMVLATPHHLHAEQTIRALEMGTHLLCEKPMSDSLEDARRMVEASRRSTSVLTFGFHLHFHPGPRRLKQLVDNGDLGTILHAHCRVGSYITLVKSVSRYQARLDGALLLDYAHQPDLLFWILGKKPIGVHMIGARGGAMELSSNPNFLSLTYDYPEPLLTTVHLNYLQMPERHEYEIVGDKGWVIWDLNTGVLRIGRRSDSSESREQISSERDPVYQEEHQAFLDSVDGKRQTESPAEDALVSQEIIEAGLQSWRKGERVALTPDQEQRE